MPCHHRALQRAVIGSRHATELSRHFRIFDWEAVRPTAIYRRLVSEEATPFLSLAVDLMRRFMPKADQRTLIMAAIWLVGQCTVFVRNREQLANPPVSLDLDDAAVERLTTLVSAWALAGLAGLANAEVSTPSPPLRSCLRNRKRGVRSKPEARSPGGSGPLVPGPTAAIRAHMHQQRSALPPQQLQQLGDVGGGPGFVAGEEVCVTARACRQPQ